MDASRIAAAPQQRHVGVVHRSDSFRYARSLLVIFLAAAVDVFDVLDRSSRGGPLRYLLLLIPIGALVAIRANGSTLIRRPRSHEIVLTALFLFGMAGTVYGTVFLGVTSTARALFFPMSLAILAVLVVEPMSEQEAGRLLRAIAVIATIYMCLAAVAYSGLIHQLLEFRQFKNATFPYVAIGIAAAYLLGHRWWAAALVGLTFVIFTGYASATSALVLLVMVIVLLATGRGASRARPYVFGIALLLAVVVAVANFGTSTRLADAYFQTVGKRNTSYGRLEFWASGIETFKESPIIGKAFASDTVVEERGDRRSPYHNDFILFMVEGGIIGVGLLVAWILLLLSDLTRRYFGFVRSDAPARATLARVLLVGLSGFIVSMAFNPVLEGLSRSATIFALAAIAATLGSPEPATEREGAAPAVTERRPPVRATTVATRRIRAR